MKMHVQGVQRYKIPIRLSYLEPLVSFREINRPSLWKWRIISLDGTLGLSPLANEGLWGSHAKMEQSFWCLLLGRGCPPDLETWKLATSSIQLCVQTLQHWKKETIQWRNQWNNPIPWREIIHSVVFFGWLRSMHLEVLVVFCNHWNLRLGQNWARMVVSPECVKPATAAIFWGTTTKFWKLNKHMVKPSRTHSSKHQQKQKTSLRSLKLT